MADIKLRRERSRLLPWIILMAVLVPVIWVVTTLFL